MAQLFQLIDVVSIIKNYNLNYFIETGTGGGETLSYIQQLDFKLIQSCEIERIQYDNLLKIFTDNRIKLWNGNSIEMLPKMLDELDGPALIYLDAHFPGAGYIRKDYVTDLYTKAQTLPLENELKILSNWKYCNKSVIIADDLRIYKKGNYQGGPWEPDAGWSVEDWLDREKLFGSLDYSFLYNTFKSTHLTTEILKHQGSILYTPL